MIYSLLRLAAFIVPLALLLAFQVNYLVAGVLAAIIGLCVSYIFLAKWRNSISEGLYETRQHKVSKTKHDEDAEDAEIAAAKPAAE